MGFSCKNGRVCGMDYIRFGTGGRVFVMLPGLGDGLKTVKGTAAPMAWMYRCFAKEFTVYMFSRKEPLPAGYTTRDMAADLAAGMAELGIEKAAVLGVSMGGMIAQWLAIDYPDMVEKLILAVTCAQPNEILVSSVEEWMEQARKDDHTALMESNLRKIYSAQYYRANKWMVPILGKVTKPKSYDRFLILAQACLTHNAAAELSKIQCPTFVIGGEQDLALGGEPSRQMAAAIFDAKLLMYPQWGHGLYEEAKDFNSQVLEFLQ